MSECSRMLASLLITKYPAVAIKESCLSFLKRGSLGFTITEFSFNFSTPVRMVDFYRVL